MRFHWPLCMSVCRQVSAPRLNHAWARTGAVPALAVGLGNLADLRSDASYTKNFLGPTAKSRF